ncbi:hypothetical protein [Photobacterium phosphoreum]|uniref:hypothetical protein n=1 Tax=Photobacterium phosphoreum TaxID=659 RepID=UPI000D1573EA|nr:hypothetical protein [Photobacterium phosphoreum]PSU61237.1 hypothetical protein CTM80_12680 [Photobacterium phosphoreum]
MFNFDAKLEEGAEAQKKAEEQKLEISNVYKELSNSLSKFLGFEVSFYETIEYEQNTPMTMTAALISNKLKKTGYKEITLGESDSNLRSKVLFKTIEPEDGYPVTIVHDKSKYISYSQEELAVAMQSIISNVSFHAALSSFKAKHQENSQ